jgi:glycosyltransferase involved in cell wall biosynthesis
MPQPFFSIVLPTKDRVFLLPQLINSVLEQEFDNYELIIVDNSDSDYIQELLNDYDDLRIRNIRTGGLNMADNWDKAISLCLGKYMILFSDKILLKKGALIFLYQSLKNTNIDCLTWGIDIFCDKENIFFSNKNTKKIKKIPSNELMSNILLSDYNSYDRAPFHCNSCVSVSLLNKIRFNFGRVSHQLNPDYTFSFQITLLLKTISFVDVSLVILRQKDFETGYGNGFSFVKKTETAAKFMFENEDWVQNVGEIREVPIVGNNFIIDIMLKDLYQILKIHNIDASDYESLNERIAHYYCRTLDEIFWRISMGVNMSEEMLMWKKTLSKEPLVIHNFVKKYSRALFFKKNKIYFLIFLKSIPLVSTALIFIRNKLKESRGTKYKNVEELLLHEKIAMSHKKIVQ